MTAVLEGIPADKSTSWSGPVRSVITPPPAGRAQGGTPGFPSGGSGGLYSSAGIFYSQNTAAQFGECGPFVNFPAIQGSGVIGTCGVGNDVWNPTPGWQQVTYCANPGNWVTYANFEAGNVGVSSYPSIGQYYSSPDEPNVGNFLWWNCTAFYSSFDEVQPQSPGIIGEAGYDIWNNSYAQTNEVMLQHDMVDPSGARGSFQTLVPDVLFGGSDGVPLLSWNLGIYGTGTDGGVGEIIWQVASGSGLYGGGITSGTFDIRAMINWLADRGYLRNGYTGNFLGLMGYGWEICSTGGAWQVYRMNGFASWFTWDVAAASPGLEMSGFGATTPGPRDTVNSVTVLVTEYQSSLGTNPCQIELWDYSTGTPEQIGITKLGARSTDSANVSTASFYTVTREQLATLRVRLYGSSASGYIESVGGVALTVNYSAFNVNAGYSISMGMS